MNDGPTTLRLTSPNGTVWLLAITDEGELTVAPAAAPEAVRVMALDAVVANLGEAVRGLHAVMELHRAQHTGAGNQLVSVLRSLC